MILTNKTNLEKITKAISEAKEEILICSAWIRSETLKKVFTNDVKKKIKEENIKLKMIIRIGAPIDIEITDKGVFDLINELGNNAKLKYHKSLHAKMYIIDNKYAMIGSFNLTGGGFGSEYHPGSNPETGVEFLKKEDIKEAKERFNDIWNNEAKIIDNKLLGFVLNPSTNDGFLMVGIKDLEINKYVEVASGSDSLLCKIIKSEKHSINFYGDPKFIDDFSFKKRMFESFASLNEIQGFAKGIIQTGNPFTSSDEQLNIASVKILKKVSFKDNLVVTSYSKIPPVVALEVREAKKETLELLYNNEFCSPAVMISNENIKVGFEPSEIASKHMAIFGTTGSGKSYFSKTLILNHLYNWFCIKNSGRIIIFDPHGEYARDIKEQMKLTDEIFEVIDTNKVEGLDKRVIADINDLLDEFDIIKPGKSEKIILQDAICKARDTGNSNDFIEHLKSKNVSTKDKIDYSKFLNIKKQIEDNIYSFLKPFEDIAKKIAEEEFINSNIVLEKGQKEADVIWDMTRKKLIEMYDSLDDNTKNTIKSQIVQDSFFKNIEKYFEVEAKQISENIITTLENNIGKISFADFNLAEKMKDNKIYCVDLSDISDEDIRFDITANIIRKVFNNKKEKKEERNTIFVVEEAHNFAPEGAGSGNPAAKMLKKIASEGRKFNLGLIVITQRPAYVSKDVLAQCSTQAIFRLINPNDIKAVGDIVEGISEDEIRRLPNYETGQAVFTGIAIREPVIVKVLKNDKLK